MILKPSVIVKQHQYYRILNIIIILTNLFMVIKAFIKV